MADLKVIKRTVEPVSEDAAELAGVLRGLAEKALRGELRGVFGILSVVDEEDGEVVHEPVLVGVPADVSDLHRRCLHLAAIVDTLDGTSWIDYGDDDEGE